ncbi:hypothetical protein [Streptomyces termitum]|uniref:hypothetical protein n=1 Tax=Streptomyces termitum TaxID=67368 RepID=UPI0033A0A8F7
MAPSNPDDNEDDGSSTTVTEDVLLAKAKAFESLMSEFSSNLYLLKLVDWTSGNPTGDYGVLLPGNTKELNSAARVQKGFAKLALDLHTALGKLDAIANSGSLNLRNVQKILGDTAAESIDATEMWEILSLIQRDGQKNSGSGSAPSP